MAATTTEGKNIADRPNLGLLSNRARNRGGSIAVSTAKAMLTYASPSANSVLLP